MADKVTVYKLLDTNDAVVGNLALAQTEGQEVTVTQLRKLPDDPTQVGQWVIDKLNEEPAA